MFKALQSGYPLLAHLSMYLSVITFFLLSSFPSCGVRFEPRSAENSGKMNGNREPVKGKNRFCCTAHGGF